MFITINIIIRPAAGNLGSRQFQKANAHVECLVISKRILSPSANNHRFWYQSWLYSLHNKVKRTLQHTLGKHPFALIDVYVSLVASFVSIISIYTTNRRSAANQQQLLLNASATPTTMAETAIQRLSFCFSVSFCCFFFVSWCIIITLCLLLFIGYCKTFFIFSLIHCAMFTYATNFGFCCSCCCVRMPSTNCCSSVLYFIHLPPLYTRYTLVRNNRDAITTLNL